MKKLFRVFPVIVVFAALACKKADDGSAAIKQLLTAHTWKSTSFTVNGTEETEWCTLNSTSKYASNGTGVFTYGDNQGACSPWPIGVNYDYDWKLLDNQTIYYPGNIPGQDDTAFIEELTDTSLKLRYRLESYNGAVIDNWVEGFTPN